MNEERIEETLIDAVDEDKVETPNDEQGSPAPPPADPRLNMAIPMLIAKVVFKSPPTSSLPEGVEPTEASQLAEQYVQNTAPLLEMISFHEALGVIGQMSNTTKLMVGGGILALNIVFLMPKKPKEKEERENKEAFAEDAPVS